MDWQDREAYRAYHRQYYLKRRQKIIDYLGGHCAVCGSTESLEIDHVSRVSKSFNISSRLTLESILEELDKCQLLCGEHHRAKTSQEQSGFRHGTMYGWMKKKCKCSLCQSAKWLWYDARNEKRRQAGSSGRGPYRSRRKSEGEVA